MKIPVTNDLYDIADRLRAVNPHYKLVFDTEKQKYEVLDAAHCDALAFVVPYRELDARTIDYARYTAVQNAERLFAEMEQHNAQVEFEQQCRIKNELMSDAERALSNR